MKPFKSLILILFFASLCNAQSTLADYRRQNATLDMLTHAKVVDHKPLASEKGIVGSPYFITTFFPGKVYLKGQLANDAYQMRYNAFKDEIEVDKGSYVEILLRNEDISAFIGNTKFIFKKAIQKNKSLKSQYFKVLHEAKNSSLLLKESVKYKEAVVAKNSQTMSFPAKYVQYEEYHFIDGNTKIAVLLNKKSILAASPKSQQGALKKYLKKESIHFDNPIQLAKLIDYYDSFFKPAQ